MVAKAAKRLSEAQAKKLLSVEHWVHDVNWEKALELLMSRPTVNIEGLVGGYTGPGGKTILPHKAVAKLDLRLVPNMTAADAIAALKAHLAKRGFADIDVNMTGGYDPNSTSVDSGLIKSQIAVLKNSENRSDHFAAKRRFMAGLCFHRRAIEQTGRTFRSWSWQRGTCAGRIFCHRIVESEDSRHRRGDDVVCSVSIRAREVGHRAPLRWTARSLFSGDTLREMEAPD